MKTQLIRLSLAASVILFTACGSSDDSSDSSNISGETVEITDATSAENAVSAISSVQGFSDSLQSVNNNVPTSSPSRLAISKASQKMDCSYGGSMSMDISSDETTGTIAYSNCAMDSSVTLNGTMSATGTDDGNSIYSKVRFNNFSMNMGESNYLKYNVTMEMETNYSYDPMKMTMDGTLSYSFDGNSGTAGYKNFTVETSGNTLEINGQTSITSTQYSCVNGAYDITTVEPLQTSYYGDNIESGKMVINGATYSFNSDGTANVTFADGSTEIVEIDDTPSCTGN